MSPTKDQRGQTRLLQPARRSPDGPGVKRIDPAATALAVVQPVWFDKRDQTGDRRFGLLPWYYTKLNPATTALALIQPVRSD